MLYFSAALVSRALGPLIALLSSPCGRHSNAAGRRRRSTRVRRYAPLPAPVEATAPAARTDRTHRASEAPKLPAPAPAPRLAPPSERLPADDIALVRPYFAVHERLRASKNPVPAPRVPAPRVPEPRCAGLETIEVRRGLDRAKARAGTMLQQWRDDPGGELSGEPAPRFEVVRARPAQRRHHRQGAPA